MRRDSQVTVVRRDGPTDDVVVREEPLTVRLAARGGQATSVWTTLRTPGHDLDLALGWCVAEGLVTGIEDVVDVHHCTDRGGSADPNTVTVRLDTDALEDLDRLARRGTSTAACGLCGRDELHGLLARCPPAPRADVVTSVAVLDRLVGELRRRQPLFAATGGCHAAGLATAAGELLVVREDIGRHNAVDAALGAVVRARRRADVLVLSGRAGFELVAKAVAARVAVVAAVGAASDLAVRTAAAGGVTLVTFVGRDHGGTVLTRADRLDLHEVHQQPDETDESDLHQLHEVHEVHEVREVRDRLDAGATR